MRREEETVPEQMQGSWDWTGGYASRFCNFDHVMRYIMDPSDPAHPDIEFLYVNTSSSSILWTMFGNASVAVMVGAAVIAMNLENCS